MMMKLPVIQQASKDCPDQIKFLKSWNISLADLLSLILLSIHMSKRGSGLKLPLEDFVFSAGGGFLFGTVAGYAIRKVMKIAAVVVGLFVAAFAYLSYKGLIDVKWVEMENVTRTALTNASGQVVHALNNTATQFAAHPSAVTASGLPITAAVGFVPGLLMGFKKG
jgi:uncharacterized membrane protein (Fun14 family)